MAETRAHEQHPGGNGQAGRPMTPAELEQDLEYTRREMNATLEELAGRFRPESMLHWAADYIQSGPKQFATNLADDVRDNPLPVVFTGIGIGWLMMSSGRRHRTAEMREPVSERVGETREEAKARMEAAREKVSGKAAQARERAEELREQGRLWAVRGMRTGSDIRERTGKAYEQQPLLMGALGVAFGALIGAAMPSVRPPSPRIEKMRAEAAGKAPEAAGTTEKTKEPIRKAGEAASSAIEEAEQQAKKTTGKKGREEPGQTPH